MSTACSAAAYPLLLVPMNIEALVVEKAAAPGVDMTPSFGKVRRAAVLGEQLTQEPCSGINPALHKRGIHLHWALPDGLTHGESADHGETADAGTAKADGGGAAAGPTAAPGGGPDFPLIPNRWLVVRLWGQGPALRCKAWVVESDTIVPDDSNAARVWPGSGLADPDLGAADVQYVGRTSLLADWAEPVVAERVALTSVGYGDPTFAAYYPACRGLLGFHDDELDPDAAGAELSYFVAGWYSARDLDPLHNLLAKGNFEDAAIHVEALGEWLGERRWTYPGLDRLLNAVERLRDQTRKSADARSMKDRLEQRARLEAAEKPPADADERARALRAGIEALDETIRRLDRHNGRRAEALAERTACLPRGIICHGLVTGIRWRVEDRPCESGVPLNEDFNLAVGETVVEALSALLGSARHADFTHVLEAFQYDLLRDYGRPGGADAVGHKVHERRFRPRSRGSRWDLAPGAPNTAPASPDDSSPPIPGDLRARLAKLNATQRDIDRRKRERDSLRGELYAAWYRKVRAGGAEKFQMRLTELKEQIATRSGDIAKLETKDPDGRLRPAGPDWDELGVKIADFLPGYTQERTDEERFWRPNDPVVLLAGPAFRRARRHGEDGRFRLDGQLLCRLSGQVITGVRALDPGDGNSLDPRDLGHCCDPLSGRVKADLPPDLATLLTEALLLTLVPTDSPGTPGPDPAASIRAQLPGHLERLWKEAEQPSDKPLDLGYPPADLNAGKPVWTLAGQFPSPAMLNRWASNPWLPLYLQWRVSWTPSYADARQALDGWELDDAGSGFEWDGKGATCGEAPLYYTGTALLTPSAGFAFSERLRQYNLSHNNPGLRRLQVDLLALDVLCQALGGFTDRLLMRRAWAEIPPLDPQPGARPKRSEIYEEVQDTDWIAPTKDHEGRLLPVRAGSLSFAKLWVVDAFGQVLALEEHQAQPGAPAELPRPLLPDRLREPRDSRLVRLEPRLAQAARLVMDWPPAEPKAGDSGADGPVCGWVLPNFLDRGLMIYDARGNALGALQSVQSKSWTQGAGARRKPRAGFHWVDIPGSRDFFFGLPPKEIAEPLGADANPHLQAFVKGMLALDQGAGAACDELLERMNEALSAAGGTGAARNPNLALLIGTPLALVRAELRLELDGSAVPGPDGGTGGIEEIAFPVRLGDRRRWEDTWLGEDGLVGFFLKGDYRQFYPAFGLEAKGKNPYLVYGHAPKVRVEGHLDLTLLMDPSRGVAVTSGILPRARFHLPYGASAETLEHKEIVFFSGPILSTAAKPRMPEPSDLYGEWSWTHHPAVEVWREERVTDTVNEQGRFFDEALQIAEGWLKLATAPLAVKAFGVKGKRPLIKAPDTRSPESRQEEPERYLVEPGEPPVLLTWSVVGADELELRLDAKTLFKTDRHPLPTQFALSVRQAAKLTLIVRARPRRGAPPPARESERMRVLVLTTGP